MTKRMKETRRYYLGLYRRSDAEKLEDVYKTCSKEKQVRSSKSNMKWYATAEKTSGF